MVKGICRLCGENTDLSYEHVPPRVAFNKNTRYTSVPFGEYIKQENPLDFKPRGKKRQGGIGYNSFCRKCNSFLGSNYVPSYDRWAKAGYQVLSKSELARIKYKVYDLEPLKILKQIISMFLAINDTWYLESYPELAEFVKDKNSNFLPEKFKVFTYLNSNGNVRYINHNVVGDFNSGSIINCSEITFPPYGYVLTFGDPDQKIEYQTDITKFKDFDFNQKKTLEFDMFQLPTHVNIALDYRAKEQVKSQIEKGKIDLENYKKEQKTKVSKTTPPNQSPSNQ
jgi:hypothetical protein